MNFTAPRLFHSARIALSLSLVVLLAACSSGGSYTPSKGYFKVGKSYKIKGKTYHPKESYTHTEVGIASWYGPGFHGRQTANGERFDENALTAAHPTLQMPSFVRVTNLENGKSVILRVNDRGPFSGGRILDVSKAGADALGFRLKGLAKVRVQVLATESKIITNAAKERVDTTGSEIALNRTGKLEARFAAYAPAGTKSRVFEAAPESPDASIMLAQNTPLYEQAAYGEQTQNAYYQPASYEAAPYQQAAVEYAPVHPSVQQAPVAAPQPITLQISTPIVEGMPKNTAQISAPTQASAYQATPAANPVTHSPQAITATPAVAQSPAPLAQTTSFTSTPTQAASTSFTGGALPSGYMVQVGNYLSKASASVLSEQLASLGQARIVPARPNDQNYFRVEFGPMQNKQAAQNMVDTLKKQGRQALVIKR